MDRIRVGGYGSLPQRQRHKTVGGYGSGSWVAAVIHPAETRNKKGIRIRNKNKNSEAVPELAPTYNNSGHFLTFSAR